MDILGSTKTKPSLPLCKGYLTISLGGSGGSRTPSWKKGFSPPPKEQKQKHKNKEKTKKPTKKTQKNKKKTKTPPKLISPKATKRLQAPSPSQRRARPRGPSASCRHFPRSLRETGATWPSLQLGGPASDPPLGCATCGKKSQPTKPQNLRPGGMAGNHQVQKVGSCQVVGCCLFPFGGERPRWP